MARSSDALATTPLLSLRKTAVSAVESALATTVATLPSQAIAVEGWRGMRVSFLSNGVNDETAVFTLYGIDPFENSVNPTGYRCQSLGTITITVGTSAQVAGTVLADKSVNNTYTWCDTVVWSASTYGTAALTYVGGNAAAFSPADNTIGEFLHSDLSNFAYIALVCTTYGHTAGRKIIPVGKFDV